MLVKRGQVWSAVVKRFVGQVLSTVQAARDRYWLLQHPLVILSMVLDERILPSVYEVVHGEVEPDMPVFEIKSFILHDRAPGEVNLPSFRGLVKKRQRVGSRVLFFRWKAQEFAWEGCWCRSVDVDAPPAVDEISLKGNPSGARCNQEGN